MLWEFDILPSPTSQPVPPHVPETSDEHLDDSLPPVNLELPASCNCYKKPLNPVCLVNIPVPVGFEEETLGNDSTSSSRVNNEMEEIQQLTQLLEVEKAIVNSGENVGEDPDDLSAGEEYDNDNTVNHLVGMLICTQKSLLWLVHGKNVDTNRPLQYACGESLVKRNCYS